MSKFCDTLAKVQQKFVKSLAKILQKFCKNSSNVSKVLQMFQKFCKSPAKVLQRYLKSFAKVLQHIQKFVKILQKFDKGSAKIWQKFFKGSLENGRSDIRSSLTYPPTYIRYHQMHLDLPTYPKIWCHMWMLPRLALPIFNVYLIFGNWYKWSCAKIYIQNQSMKFMDDYINPI